MKKKFNTVEEMKKAFEADGWKNVSFTEYEEHGKKLFIMKGTGNIFTNTGDIYMFNVPVMEEVAYV